MRATLILCLGSLLLLGCAVPEARPTELATLSVNASAARTLISVGTAAVASYQATLAQGVTTVATTASATTSLSFSEILTGTYTLTVGAYNASTVLMAQSSQSVTLVAGTNSAAVTLAWVSGTGTFAYTATVPTSVGVTAMDYSYVGLSDPGMTSSGNLTLALASGTTTGTLASLPLASGDYSFTFRLLVGATSLLQYTEAVQVLAGAPTTGTRTLTASDLASAPPVPTLSVTLASGTATVTWKYQSAQVNTTTGYTLQRKLSTDGSYTSLTTPAATSYSYADSTVVGGKTYNYQLLATNAFGSTTSAAISLTTRGVTYDGNGATSGTVPTDTHAYAPGETVTAQANSGTLAKSGYLYTGWNSAADGSGIPYTAGSGSFTIAADTTVYALWGLYVISGSTITDAQAVIYTITGSTCTVTSGTGASGAVTIPATIAGYTVTTIDENAFLNNTNLTSVTIPASVTSIEQAAFQNCTSLASFIFQGTRPTAGYQIFLSCSSLLVPGGIQVPSAYLSDYTTNWTDYSSYMVGY